MTECERIISDGIVTTDFLKEEIRDEYTISTKMKKVWTIELDLFLKFQELCEKHHLRFWVAYGTLLGAARHKGFIPWDDDFDVWMPREDYDKLLKINPEEIEAPYFLQTTLNDEDYYSAFARLRNSNTTGILVSPKNRCNNGIYLDIYPIDGLYDSKWKDLLRSKWIHFNNIISHAYTFNINPSIITRFIHYILHLPGIKYDNKKVYKMLNQLASSYNWSKASEVGVVIFNAYPKKNSCYCKDDFMETVYLPFENIKVPVPVGYKNILSVLYGDFMKFPPVEERGIWHNFIFETDVPYKTYCREQFGVDYE